MMLRWISFVLKYQYVYLNVFILMMIVRCKVLGVIDLWIDFGGFKWDVIFCNFLVWIIVFLVLFKGIKFFGKVNL